MKRKKHNLATGIAKFALNEVINLAEDIVGEAVSSVPGYPKCESYGQYLRRKQQQRRR